MKVDFSLKRCTHCRPAAALSTYKPRLHLQCCSLLTQKENEPWRVSYWLLLLLSRFSRVRLCATPRRQPTRLPCPWDSPDKNTGVGCHFLLQCRKVKSEREVLSRVRLFMTPQTAAHQAPLSMGFSRQECWSGVPLPSPSPQRGKPKSSRAASGTNPSG